MRTWYEKYAFYIPSDFISSEVKLLMFYCKDGIWNICDKFISVRYWTVQIEWAD